MIQAAEEERRRVIMEPKEMRESVSNDMREKLAEAFDNGRDRERDEIIEAAKDEVEDILLLYYTLEDPFDLERARNLWRAYNAIDLLTERDWIFIKARARNLVAEVDAKECQAAEERRDDDAKEAEATRQWEMKDKIPALKR